MAQFRQPYSMKFLRRESPQALPSERGFLGLAGRGDAAQVRPRALAAHPLRVVPGGDQQQRGGVRADAVQGQQARRAGGD